MRMSESIKKNLYRVSVGSILNSLKMKRRRSTLFFDGIGSEYIRRCEVSGHGEDIKHIGREWTNCVFGNLLLSSLKRLPLAMMLNTVMKKVWHTGGLMDDFHATVDGDNVTINTVNEALTRTCGSNGLLTGFYMGILNVLTEREIKEISVSQTKEKCEYGFLVTQKKFHPPPSKNKETYNKLNTLKDAGGVSLKTLLSKRVLALRENRIYFRDRTISPMENTLFHLLGIKGPLLDEVPKISHDYFKELVGPGSDTEKLTLIKNLLQSWGRISIASKESETVFRIDHPPFGFQADKDNWDFLIRVILGYLWLMDRKYSLAGVRMHHMTLMVTYSSA